MVPSPMPVISRTTNMLIRRVYAMGGSADLWALSSLLNLTADLTVTKEDLQSFLRGLQLI